jgi:hypothetical protein
MLRVSYSDGAEGQRWSLCGRLAGPWVDELAGCWRQARERAPLARAVVDLKDVTFIDDGGERLLAEMTKGGAEIVAAGVENRDVVDGLKTSDGRPMRRFLEHFCGSCEARKNGKGGDK